MSALAPIGHNNPPDPIDEATAPFGDVIAEAENWLDGSPVQTEDQMKAVDVLIRGIKDARKAVDAARDAVTKPLHDAWKAEVARWKPTQDDLDRIQKGLLALVDAFKRRLAAEKAEAERQARAEAEAKRRAAEEAARQADAADIDAQRAAALAQAEAEEAQRRAAAASRDKVKGLRTVTRHEVIDAVALARWLWAHDREAVLAFHADRARALNLHIPGVVERVAEKVAV